MNSNDGGKRESRTGDHKKRKMIWNQELPSNLRKRIKKDHDVSRQALYEASLTPAVWRESNASPEPKTSPNPLHKPEFSASHFSGAQNCISNGGTFINLNVLGNYTAVAESSDVGSWTRSSNNIIKSFTIIPVENISMEREIYKGRGYRVHTAEMSGKIVAMKVYEGNRARERFLEATRFNQNIAHPNIAQVIGVSPPKSDPSYLIFDGEYEGAIHDILGQALKKDLQQVLTLGLQTVIGLSSGLDYLQDLKYPFASVGLDHFAVLSRKGKPIISFDPDDLSQINEFDHQPDVSNSAEAIFHKLCRRTFDSACKARYKSKQNRRAYADEFDTNLPENRFEELDSSDLVPSLLTSGRPSLPISPRDLLPSGRCQELVWKSPTAEAVSLNDISNQFQNFLNTHLLSSEPALIRRRGRYTARTAHRCPGYNRIEITLTANIMHSAIVSHSSPIPHEICPVCKEVVKDTDVFHCMCGGDDDESMPTVRCTSCSEWHHRPCVITSNVEPLTFVCARCQKRAPEQAGPHQEAIELRPPPHTDHTDRIQSLNKLADVLATRFERKGELEDLDECIRCHREALKLGPGPHSDRSYAVSSLAKRLLTRFRTNGDIGDLDESIQCHWEVVELRPPSHQGRAYALHNLAMVLSLRFEEKGVVEDLDESIQCYREALELKTPSNFRRSLTLNYLADALSIRYDRKEDSDDLDESIRYYREALELSPHPDRFDLLTDLAKQLETRFEKKGDIKDLDDSIRCHRKALELRPS